MLDRLEPDYEAKQKAKRASPPTAALKAKRKAEEAMAIQASNGIRSAEEQEIYDSFPAPQKDVDAQTTEEDAGGYEGETVTVTWGREHIQPVQYNGMDLGPFVTTTTVRTGETLADAIKRALMQLDVAAEAEFQRKLPAFLQRIRDSANY